jgi:hypothetical protein
MRKPVQFTFRLNVTGEQIGTAAFYALVASAWAVFNAIVLTHLAVKQELSTKQRCEKADLAFSYVVDSLPADSPYRAELARFRTEALPQYFDGSTDDGGVLWKLN